MSGPHQTRTLNHFSVVDLDRTESVIWACPWTFHGFPSLTRPYSLFLNPCCGKHSKWDRVVVVSPLERLLATLGRCGNNFDRKHKNKCATIHIMTQKQTAYTHRDFDSHLYIRLFRLSKDFPECAANSEHATPHHHPTLLQIMFSSETNAQFRWLMFSSPITRGVLFSRDTAQNRLKEIQDNLCREDAFVSCNEKNVLWVLKFYQEENMVRNAATWAWMQLGFKGVTTKPCEIHKLWTPVGS